MFNKIPRCFNAEFSDTSRVMLMRDHFKSPIALPPNATHGWSDHRRVRQQMLHNITEGHAYTKGMPIPQRACLYQCVSSVQKCGVCGGHPLIDWSLFEFEHRRARVQKWAMMTEHNEARIWPQMYVCNVFWRPHVQAWLSWSERGTVNP